MEPAWTFEMGGGRSLFTRDEVEERVSAIDKDDGAERSPPPCSDAEPGDQENDIGGAEG
jgi:hypothetical protein